MMTPFELEEATEDLMEALGLDLDDDEAFLTIADALEDAYEAGQDALVEEVNAINS